jgi:hypothetical protein
MSRTRRFLDQPPRTELAVAVVIDPPGAASAVHELAIDGALQGPQPTPPGVILRFPCNRPDTTYGLHLDMAWQAQAHVVVSTFVTQPDGTVVERTSIVMEGQANDADTADIGVLTANG